MLKKRSPAFTRVSMWGAELMILESFMKYLHWIWFFGQFYGFLISKPINVQLNVNGEELRKRIQPTLGRFAVCLSHWRVPSNGI